MMKQHSTHPILVRHNPSFGLGLSTDVYSSPSVHLRTVSSPLPLQQRRSAVPSAKSNNDDGLPTFLDIELKSLAIAGLSLAAYQDARSMSVSECSDVEGDSDSTFSSASSSLLSSPTSPSSPPSERLLSGVSLWRTRTFGSSSIGLGHEEQDGDHVDGSISSSSIFSSVRSSRPRVIRRPGAERKVRIHQSPRLYPIIVENLPIDDDEAEAPGSPARSTLFSPIHYIAVSSSSSSPVRECPTSLYSLIDSPTSSASSPTATVFDAPTPSISSPTTTCFDSPSSSSTCASDNVYNQMDSDFEDEDNDLPRERAFISHSPIRSRSPHSWPSKSINNVVLSPLQQEHEDDYFTQLWLNSLPSSTSATPSTGMTTTITAGGSPSSLLTSLPSSTAAPSTSSAAASPSTLDSHSSTSSWFLSSLRTLSRSTSLESLRSIRNIRKKASFVLVDASDERSEARKGVVVTVEIVDRETSAVPSVLFQSLSSEVEEYETLARLVMERDVDIETVTRGIDQVFGNGAQ